MKVLLMSDLHIDVCKKITGRSIFPSLVNHVKNHQPDLLVIAGDLTGSAFDTLHYIHLLQERTGVQVKFVPGNHDIWTRPTKKDASMHAYQSLKEDPSSLLDNPFVTDKYAIIGGMGWYDYSFVSDMVTDQQEIVSFKKIHWNDAKFANWGMDDVSLCRQERDALEMQLNSYQNKKIIMVTHTVPYKDFTIYKPRDPIWNMCNAFMGSQQLGELFDRYSNIEYITFGHTHHRFGEVSFGDKTIICKPFGYPNEWKTNDVEAELEDASTILHI